jgi:hypothetical protein
MMKNIFIQRHKTIVLIIAASAALALGSCENVENILTENILKEEGSNAPLSAFTFIPTSLQEGKNAVAGIKAGDFNIEGVEFYDSADEAGRDNGSFEIEGKELSLAEDLAGGPYYVKFSIAGGSLTYQTVIFVAFADGPTDIKFETAYRLMKNTAAARGLGPVGTFEPEGGTPPYSYSVVSGNGTNDANNGSFRGGADGVYAKSGLDARTYNIYVRCTDYNGRHYQKALAVTVSEYASPDFEPGGDSDFPDFARFDTTLVNGSYDYDSKVFFDGRNLTIPEFMLARYELTQTVFWDVYQWAIHNDREEKKYTFLNDTKLPTTAPSDADAGKPQVGVKWRNVVLWLNAFSEKNGLTPVYYSDEDRTQVLRSTSTKFKSGTSNNIHEEAIFAKTDTGGYRLPWQTEWEFAARGGIPSEDSGSVWLYQYAGTNSLDELRLKYGTDSLQPVGLMLPNTAGLYDMTGNAPEWCGDNYVSPYFTELTADTPFEGPQNITRMGQKDYDYDLAPYTKNHPMCNGKKVGEATFTSSIVGEGIRIARTPLD